MSTWNSYPRPQLKRDGYYILNENWTCNGQTIRMPFAPQSRLSGYEGEVSDVLVYETDFSVPEKMTKKRFLLHFGAVDQVAEVWLNGTFLGKHEGGYLPFTFEVTRVLRRGKANHLKVKAVDTLDHKYPYGKQTKKRGGMWYTPVSGIWQPVWLENVPECYVENLRLTPDLRGVKVELDCKEEGCMVNIPLEDGEFYSCEYDSNEFYIDLASFVKSDGTVYHPNHWTPENPHLYTMYITTKEDFVETYFALRTIEIKPVLGVQRVCLNGTPVFMHGVLDQGYYEDGIFLPEQEEEFERDVLRMKELGYNMLRKHIKIEPLTFYYACDRLGMLVMQDMVNNGSYSWLFDTALPTIGMKKKDDTKKLPDEATMVFFKQHMLDTIDYLYNHPSIIAYTIFNEGWGQFKSDEMYELAKKQDPTRLYDSTSGWFAQKKNDFDSEHIYFKVIDLPVKERPMFLSECGGYTLAVEGHRFNPEKQYGYGKCKDSRELTDMILHMYRKMVVPFIKSGACGCIYTQLSDVEDEINGLYTYDREVCKVVKEDMQALAAEIDREIKGVL